MSAFHDVVVAFRYGSCRRRQNARSQILRSEEMRIDGERGLDGLKGLLAVTRLDESARGRQLCLKSLPRGSRGHLHASCKTGSASRVWHKEFTPAGRARSSGECDCRHRPGRSAGTALARARAHMRVLWTKAGKLLPVDTGGKIRSYNLLRH